jgi:putative transposase
VSFAWRVVERILRLGRPPALERATEDVVLTAQLEAAHNESRGTYGAPRLHAELAENGVHVGKKRVARLMRKAGLVGVSPRMAAFTTVRDPDAHPSADLVQRDFTASGPDQLWVADITYVPTWAGFLYRAIVLDVWSRKVVGWAMSTTLHTDVVLDALNMAVTQRQPRDVIHHSDGCQYTSFRFGRRCKEAGVRPSMGTVGDAYDNAMCESFFGTLECELLDRRRFRSQAEARMAVFDYLEGFYNPRRRHSALDYKSTMEQEASRARRVNVSPNPSTEPGQLHFRTGGFRTGGFRTGGSDCEAAESSGRG